MMNDNTIAWPSAEKPSAHPRRLGWIGTAALAMGGSNQSLFLVAGATGLIATQGTAAVALLVCGLLIALAAAPAWTELVLMSPNRVGGIAASCSDAFRPYSEVLSNLTGVCYWWGWIPTCGLAALLSASALHRWYLPHVPIPILATGIVVAFTLVNLAGITWVARLAVPIAIGAAALAFVSGLAPIFSGDVNWKQSLSFNLTSPFPGLFGKVTSAMAGLYLVGFAAPAFESAACHVGETVDPARNVPRAMLASAAMAAVYFVLLPLVWLGLFGSRPLVHDLAGVLGPSFAPVLGPAAKAAAVWFLTLNMFQGTLQPLAGASRTLSQLAEDGLLPHMLARRSKTDCPWAATLLTAAVAIAFLLTNDPVWVVAAANLCYLIGICLPNVAVWLLRRDAPDAPRPFRAPDWAITLGLLAAAAWTCSTVFGFEQFGLPTVLAGLVLAGSGSVFFAYRKRQDERANSRTHGRWTLHVKLTGAMLLVLILDGAGYLTAIGNVSPNHPALIAGLSDIFVIVALLTISLGLVLPGMISQAAKEVARGARRLAEGTLADFTRAMVALGEGDLESAHARIDVVPIKVHTSDEMAEMAEDFNRMQEQIARAAIGLAEAREGVRTARADLTRSNERFELAVAGSRDGLWDWELHTDEVFYSPGWKAILGYKDSELPNTIESWEGRLHPDDRQRVIDTIQDYLDGKTPEYQAEYRMRDREGEYRWLLAKGVALRDAAGTAYRMAGSHTDITDQKIAERERRQLDNHIRLLLQSSTNGIYGIDLRGDCTFINTAGARILGYEPSELIGRNMHYMIHHSHADGTVYSIEGCPVIQTLRLGDVCTLDNEVFWKKDGTPFSTEYSSSPIVESGETKGAVVTFFDISTRKQTQAELLQAKLAAEAASRTKSLFLATMSHELRTPLNAVIGFSEMLKGQTVGPLNEKQARFVDNTLTSGKRLLSLIESVLDLSRLETGEAELELNQIDAVKSITAVVDSLRDQAAKKQIALQIVGDEALPPLIADENRIAQILKNLISNALKFTQSGGRVSIAVRCVGREMLIAVRDTGIGLNRENLESIWGNFTLVDASYSRKQQGSGLGLSVARMLVELHRGRIWAESAGEGKGSTFYVALPILEAQRVSK